MKFLCLGHFDCARMDALSQSDIDALMARCMTLVNELYATGLVLLDAGLDTAMTSARRSGGRIHTTDGPFTEAKELVGGVFLLEAGDMAEATRIASMHPAVAMPEAEDLGWWLEIRPVHSFYAPE
jgi:hypothetical protein